MKSLINIHEGSNLTEISPILTCLRSLKESEALWQGEKSQCFKSLSLKQLKDEASISSEDGFCFAVSLQDGSALYMSSSITLHLGYPKDMLVGQCIMNFLYQKDHITFANHLTQGLNACFIQGKRDDSHLVPNAFFCRLRLYHGLKYGYGVSEKKTQYKPFKVTLHIKDLILDDIYVEKCASTLCVKATATPVSSAYTVPEEIPAMTSFSTRHTASCHFSHVDASAIPYLGFLPQDMVGYSVFDFYHVDDMPQMKDIYELVVKEQGTSFRSKPYRFKVQNGCFVMLETEWSCFINPWSRKLEFVVGQHRVLKGPADVNIFNLCEIEEVIVPEEILKESCNIQKEIKTLLSQSMKNTRAEKSKRICNKRKRDLASFVNNCIDEEYGCVSLKYAQKQSCIEDACNSDLDSVVIGNISLHRGANDSSGCSETSTTVQQLQYQENIERFFASQPKTYSRGSNEFSTNSKAVSTTEEYQASPETSGTASKDQQDSPSNSNVGETKVQESGSNSSKCNNSSFTTGDSGYDNSIEKNKKGNPNNNNNSNPANNKNINDHQTWKTTTDCNTEKISSCVALTEETLTAHDRLNHRFLKHRRNKMSLTNAPLHNEANRVPQQDESVPRKKFVTMSTLTQTDEVRVQPMSPSPKVEFAKPQTPRKPTVNPVTVSSAPQTVPTPGMYAAPSHQYAFAPSSVALPAMPTPFLIPVVYMGAMPYYAPISNMMPSTGIPFWPTTAMPLSSFSPMTPTSSNMQTNATVEPPVIVQSSGVTATLPVATTTTTFASGTSPLFKNSKTSINAQCSESQANEEQVYMETNDSSDNMLCDSESSGPIGCSMNSSSGSRNNTEEIPEMYLESKRLPRDSSQNTPQQDNPTNMTTKISYQYQMTVPDIRDILRKDHEFLSSHKQPDVVNQQLQMLQKEYAAENLMDEKDKGHMDSTMLGLGQQGKLKKELENREENLMQLMCDDV